MCEQLYSHVNTALDHIMETVISELTMQFIPSSFSRSRHQLVSTSSSHLNRESSSRQHSFTRSNLPTSSPKNSRVDRTSGMISSVSEQSLSASFDLSHLSSVAASKLGIAIQPVVEFLVERLLTLKIWLCDEDARQVRETLCMHIAEVGSIT